MITTIHLADSDKWVPPRIVLLNARTESLTLPLFALVPPIGSLGAAEVESHAVRLREASLTTTV